MSIVALKRKTEAQYKVLSTNQKNFSLNGTRRLQGFIGQNIISRSFPKTPMKGNTACGYGGCCGEYKKGPIVSPLCAGDFTNDTKVVKKSVLSNDGQLELRFPPRNFTTKKPDSGLNNNTSQEYTKAKRAESILKDKHATLPVECCPNPLFKTYNNYQQKSRRYPTHITKAANTAVDSSTYTQNLYSSLCACKEKKPQKRTSNMPPFGATVQTQPRDQQIATYYDKINRNFYLSSVKLLHDCCKK